MNREIKFRAWDVEENMFHYGVECGVDMGVQWSFGDMLTSKRFHVMQYTGLKDCNGKEIYEGDVMGAVSILGSCMNAVVEFDSGGFYATHVGGSQWTDHLNRHTYSEIIGNRFENPELLEP